MSTTVGSGSSGTIPTVIDWAKEKINEGLEFKEKHETQIEKGLELRELPTLVKDAFQSTKDLKESGFSEAWSKAREELVDEAKNPSAPLDLIHKLKIGAGAFQAVSGLTRLPADAKGVWEAAKTLMPGSEKTGGAAADVRHEGLRDMKDMAWTGQATFDTALTGQKLVSTYKAAGAAFTEAVPGASKEVVRAAQRSAVKEAFKSGAKEAVKDETVEAAKKTVGDAAVKASEKSAAKTAEKTTAKAVEKATEKGVEKAAEKGVEKAAVKGVEKATAEAATKAVVKTGEKAIAEAAVREGGEVAAKAALKATAHAAESTLAKAAGRFAPGVNVAIAAIDVADAVNTLRNPDAGTGKKVCSCITAVGSIAAATNIPVVSQIGAGVSIVGSFIGAFLK
jgi:hypothetical protein